MRGVRHGRKGRLHDQVRQRERQVAGCVRDELVLDCLWWKGWGSVRVGEVAAGEE